MCCTFHAGELTGTKIYAGESLYRDHYVHLLGYQNNAQNLYGSPNAMILPIPSLHPLGPANAIDTRGFQGFLGDIAEATKEQTDGFDEDLEFGGPACAGVAPEVFQVGSYTVVVGSQMGAAVKAVKQLPKSVQPEINFGVLHAMAALYKGWSFAFCCWDGTAGAEPLLWRYQPMDPSRLFAPALDAHNGSPPADGDVEVDHIVMFGSTITPTGHTLIEYADRIPDDVRQTLPSKAVGQKLSGKMANGDFWFPTSQFVGDLLMQRPYRGYPEPAFRAFPGAAKTKTIPLGQWH